MEQINPKLFDHLRKRLGVSASSLYRRIEQRARGSVLPRHLAALEVARAAGLNIAKFASIEELASLRGGLAKVEVSPEKSRGVEEVAGVAESRRSRPRQRSVRGGRPSKRGNSVFVVHGRNERLRRAVFQFLRAAGVHPIEWSKAIAMTGKASPYVGEILEVAFGRAQAVVVLLSPDDEAKLKDEFTRPQDPTFERRLTGQARPNVLFEAGMAFGSHPDKTVLVEVGELRPFSDTFGRHVVRLSNSLTSRQEMMVKLSNAGCSVDFTTTDWQSEGDFGF